MSAMRISSDYLLLSFHRAALTGRAVASVVAAAILSAAVVAAFLIVVTSPSFVARRSEVVSDGRIDAANRVGKVMYVSPRDGSDCRRFQFDNATAQLQENGVGRCSTVRRPMAGRESYFGAIRDAFRKRANSEDGE